MKPAAPVTRSFMEGSLCAAPKAPLRTAGDHDTPQKPGDHGRPLSEVAGDDNSGPSSLADVASRSHSARASTGDAGKRRSDSCTWSPRGCRGAMAKPVPDPQGGTMKHRAFKITVATVVVALVPAGAALAKTS